MIECRGRRYLQHGSWSVPSSAWVGVKTIFHFKHWQALTSKNWGNAPVAPSQAGLKFIWRLGAWPSQVCRRSQQSATTSLQPCDKSCAMSSVLWSLGQMFLSGCTACKHMCVYVCEEPTRTWGYHPAHILGPPGQSNQLHTNIVPSPLILDPQNKKQKHAAQEQHCHSVTLSCIILLLLFLLYIHCPELRVCSQDWKWYLGTSGKGHWQENLKNNCWTVGVTIPHQLKFGLHKHSDTESSLPPARTDELHAHTPTHTHTRTHTHFLCWQVHVGAAPGRPMGRHRGREVERYRRSRPQQGTTHALTHSL